MEEKKTVKVNCVGCHNSFSKNNNWYIRTLSKYYNIEISEKPDFLIYSCFLQNI